jgi:PAS domain S-box-containing protein
MGWRILTLHPLSVKKNGLSCVLEVAFASRFFYMHDQSDIAARHLAKVVESSDDAIVSKDLNSTIISWNRAAERMFGYSAEEAIGRSIRMLIPADLQGEEDDVLARIRAGEVVDHYETIRMRKDGQLLAISLTVSPIRSESGEIIGASKIARDISERTRLEAAAREHAAITEKLAEVGAVVTSTLDREIIVQKVTDTATQLTHAEFGAFFYNVRDPESGDAYMLYTLSGAPAEAFAKLPHPRATAIFGPTFRGEGVVRLDDVTEDPRYGQSPPYFGMPPGHLPVRSYMAVPVKGVSGDVLGGLFFGHSRPGVFTLQHERLAQGVASWASVALENARLYVEAHTANRMKDEFLAVLSHELRTPLNAILGYARLLRSGVLSGDKAARGLETLERNATWLTQIVEDVLDVSRIVSGKIRLNIQRVELALIVDNAAATIQPAADAKGVRVETVIDSRVGPVSVDPDRMQQVVWNLLSNAVKFTPEGGTVRIALNRKDSGTELAVEDTGAGIRADFLPFVFERFRQGEAGTTRKTGGLGLGLAIVRHIVEMHGGTVKAESAGEGKGARFSIELPRTPAQRPPAGAQWERAAVTERSSVTELGDLTGVRVMAIDDEADALTLLRVVLESAGAEVTSLASCVAALEQIGSLRPQVVVVDLGMPVMDGFDFIARIRQSADPEIRDVPAAAVTAFARSEDRTKALRNGFDVHLSKPVDPGELVATVGMLARRAARPAPRS